MRHRTEGFGDIPAEGLREKLRIWSDYVKLGAESKQASRDRSMKMLTSSIPYVYWMSLGVVLRSRRVVRLVPLDRSSVRRLGNVHRRHRCALVIVVISLESPAGGHIGSGGNVWSRILGLKSLVHHGSGMLGVSHILGRRSLVLGLILTIATIIAATGRHVARSLWVRISLGVRGRGTGISISTGSWVLGGIVGGIAVIAILLELLRSIRGRAKVLARVMCLRVTILP